MTMTHDPFPASGLPDPIVQAEFYQDVPVKRLIAWVADTVAIVALTAVVVLFTAFTALFFLPLAFLAVGFLYRWVTLANRSATPGMRLVAIEIRAGDGGRLDPTLAGLHTLGYTVSMAIFPLQLISIALMLMTERRQGLTDHVLGTAALNRAAGT
ncbi:RDD family protein [Palleronia sp. KMU-117]|uniref:RDD family protein n=1 Tax=Palleronia sp. KMU-117 TaxID=3434108 RepID=UPI003D74D400